MRLASLLIYAAVLLGVSVGALKCFNCNNCAKFEGSQSVACSSEATRCLKLHHQSGQISRECSTQEKCADKDTEPNLYTAVHCCEGDNCNSGMVAKACLATVAMAILVNVLY